jgi:hypothetical protein
LVRILPSTTEELKLQINDDEADCLLRGLATVFDAVMANSLLRRGSLVVRRLTEVFKLSVCG